MIELQTILCIKADVRGQKDIVCEFGWKLVEMTDVLDGEIKNDSFDASDSLVTLTFSRDTEMSNYDKVKKLEDELDIILGEYILLKKSKDTTENSELLLVLETRKDRILRDVEKLL